MSADQGAGSARSLCFTETYWRVQYSTVIVISLRSRHRWFKTHLALQDWETVGYQKQPTTNSYTLPIICSVYGFLKTPNMAVERLALRLHIREVPASELDPEIGYPGWDVLWSSSVLPFNLWTDKFSRNLVLTLCHCRLSQSHTYEVGVVLAPNNTENWNYVW